jgi:hypothetical protein
VKVEVKVGGRGGSAGVAVARWRGRAVCVRVHRDPQPECIYMFGRAGQALNYSLFEMFIFDKG